MLLKRVLEILSCRKRMHLCLHILISLVISSNLASSEPWYGASVVPHQSLKHHQENFQTTSLILALIRYSRGSRQKRRCG
ncbi:hypothetical protein DL93DRAFT_1708397 [Clavulina sp. PMI_390]|nr:hypothetical protein DL93DRAFT_1708397 [Clavulina sp. PMI_390]